MDRFKNAAPHPDDLANDSGLGAANLLDNVPAGKSPADDFTSAELRQGYMSESMDEVDKDLEFPQPGFAWSRMGD